MCRLASLTKLFYRFPSWMKAWVCCLQLQLAHTFQRQTTNRLKSNYITCMKSDTSHESSHNWKIQSNLEILQIERVILLTCKYLLNLPNEVKLLLCVKLKGVGGIPSREGVCVPIATVHSTCVWVDTIPYVQTTLILAAMQKPKDSREGDRDKTARSLCLSELSPLLPSASLSFPCLLPISADRSGLLSKRIITY